MLELKNVVFNLGHNVVSRPLSFILYKGCLCCVGGAAEDRTSLVRAVLGFVPVESGYISYEDEVVTRLSAVAFRKHFFYIPSDISRLSDWSPKPFDNLSVRDLLQTLCGLRSNGVKIDEDRLKKDFETLGLDFALYDRPCFELSENVLQRAMLALAPQMGKALLIADGLTSDMDLATERLVVNFLSRLMGEGMMVLLSCRDGDPLLNQSNHEHIIIRNLVRNDAVAPTPLRGDESAPVAAQ